MKAPKTIWVGSDGKPVNWPDGVSAPISKFVLYEEHQRIIAENRKIREAMSERT